MLAELFGGLPAYIANFASAYESRFLSKTKPEVVLVASLHENLKYAASFHTD